MSDFTFWNYCAFIEYIYMCVCGGVIVEKIANYALYIVPLSTWTYFDGSYLGHA